MSKAKITLLQVKEALNDHRFRETLPAEMRQEINSYLDNPSCPCNVDFLRKLVRDCKKQLQAYFPAVEVEDDTKELQALAQNKWKVINCHVAELENELKKLGPGRKQLELARYQDQVTVVVNDLDLVY